MPIFIHEKHDIGIIRTDDTEVGLMLATIDGKPAYRTSTERYLKNQYYSGAPDYGALDPQSELPIILDDWRAGFGLEVAASADPTRYYSSVGMDARHRGMLIAGWTPTVVAFPDKSHVPHIVNADMELETGWNYDDGDVTISTTKKQAGTSSLRITVTGTEEEQAYQYLVGWTSGCEYTMTCYAAVDNPVCRARIGLTDGASTTYSSINTSTTMVQHSVSHTIAASAQYLKAILSGAATTGTATLYAYFDVVAMAVADTSGAVAYSDVCRDIEDFNDKLYFTLGKYLCELDEAGSSLLTVFQGTANLTDLEPFVDTKLYIAQGWDADYSYLDGSDSSGFPITSNTSKHLKFMKTVHTTADTLYGSDSNNTITSNETPTAGTAWAATTTVGADYHDITDLVSWKGLLYIMKEDKPFYLDATPAIQGDLAMELETEYATTSGKNAFVWKNKLYIPAGDQALLETDGTTNTFRNPANYCTNLADFVGRITAIAGDGFYLYITVNNGSDSEILAGRLETIDGTTSWVWHPIAELPISGIHKESDTTNTIVAADADDQASIDTLLNEIKDDYNLHIADTTYHLAADIYTITSDDSSSEATAIALANEIKSDFMSHAFITPGNVHISNEGDTIITSDNATDLATAITLANEIKADYNTHIALGSGVETVFVSNIYQKRLWVAPTNADGDLYYLPLPKGYGDIVGDGNRLFKTDTNFITSGQHGGFKGENKYWRKATATLGHSHDTDVYFELHFMRLGDGDYSDPADGGWVDVGNFVGSTASMTQSLYIPANTEGVSPVSPMMWFKLVAKTDDTDLTPILLNLDIRAILKPPARKIIECAVRCADGILDRDGQKLEGTSAAYIRTVLDEARDSTSPFTLYDPWGTSHTCIMLPNDPESTIQTDLKNENPEQFYFLRMQEVTIA